MISADSPRARLDSGTFNQELEEKRVHTFPNDMSLKVNITAQLEFELGCFYTAVLNFNHYASGANIFPELPNSGKVLDFSPSP